MTFINIKDIRFGLYSVEQKISRVVIEGDKPFLKYTVGNLNNPTRLYVDIEIAKMAMPIAPIIVNLPIVTQIRLGQYRPEIVRVVLELDQEVKFKIFTLDSAGKWPYRLVIDLESKIELEVKPENEVVVMIDPGHGGKDPGAIGVNGIMEKKVTLAISKYLGKMLEAAGHQVNYTRVEDVTLSLSQRTQIINGANPDLALSVHCNSFMQPSAQGIETFYFPTKHSARPFAQSVQQELIEAFGWSNRGVKTGNYHIVREPKIQKVILPEIGFLSNPKEGKAMAKDKNQYLAAEALAKGIKKYLTDDKS